MEASGLGLGLPTLKFHCVDSRRRITPVCTGVSLEDGATSMKKIPVREGGCKGEMGRSSGYKFGCLGLTGFI